MAAHTTPDDDSREEALDVLRLLGHVYLRQGHPAEALVMLKALSLLKPDDVSASLSVASAHVRLGEGEEAMAVLDQLLDAGVDHPALYLLRGQALAMTGYAEQAVRSVHRFARMREHSESQESLRA